MFHMIDLDLDLVHTVCHLLLHNRLLHLAFQCLEGFRQLLAIYAMLLLKSAIVLVCKAPLSFQLSNLGQQFRLSLLRLLPECKDHALESHQTIPSLSVSTSKRNAVLVVQGACTKIRGIFWGEHP